MIMIKTLCRCLCQEILLSNFIGVSLAYEIVLLYLGGTEISKYRNLLPRVRVYETVTSRISSNTVLFSDKILSVL